MGYSLRNFYFVRLIYFIYGETVIFKLAHGLTHGGKSLRGKITPGGKGFLEKAPEEKRPEEKAPRGKRPPGNKAPPPWEMPRINECKINQ